MRRVLLLVPLLVLGCADERPPSVVEGRSTAESGRPCIPASPVAASPPAGLPELPAGAVLTEAAPGRASGRVTGEIRDVVAELKASFERAGYVVQREEDEGRSFRLAFFGASGDATLTVAELTCPPGSTGFSVIVRRPAS